MKLTLDIIGILSVFIFSIFAVVLLKEKNKNNIGNKFFSGFLIINILLLVFSILYRNELIVPSNNILLYYFTASLFFLLAPFLYFYFASNFKNIRFIKLNYLHFILPAIVFLLLTTNYYVRLNEIKDVGKIHMWTSYSYHVFLALLNIQTLFYIWKIIRSAKVYYEDIKTLHSDSTKTKDSWFRVIITIFISHWILDILTSYSVFWNSNITSTFEFLSLSVLLLFATIIVYKGLKGEILLTEDFDQEKYKNSILTENQIIEYGNKLQNFMISNKPYLSPTLTLNELAESMDIHPKYLSQIINEKFNQNFFDFVNSFRVKEAKEKLVNKNSQHSNKTILEVLFEVGFNSKSAFNRAFKKQIGLTPTQFRNGEFS